MWHNCGRSLKHIPLATFLYAWLHHHLQHNIQGSKQNSLTEDFETCTVTRLRRWILRKKLTRCWPDRQSLLCEMDSVSVQSGSRGPQTLKNWFCVSSLFCYGPQEYWYYISSLLWILHQFFIMNFIMDWTVRKHRRRADLLNMDENLHYLRDVVVDLMWIKFKRNSTKSTGNCQKILVI